MPRYATCHISIVATGKEGSAPGELDVPSGVAIHEDTHQIFITNQLNDRVEIFTETGEFLYQLGVGHLFRPYGIALHGDRIYVSCTDDTVSKFSMNEMWCVRRVGGNGSRNGQFNTPRQLTTDQIGRVFIADYSNKRICIHDPDLNHLRNIRHRNISQPSDVKVSRDRLYVLCPFSNPCIQVLSLEGYMLHSLITSGRDTDVSCPYFFCLDPFNSFVISDYSSHSIRVFSPEGNLLHTVGGKRHQRGRFYHPRGVAITPNGRLICVSKYERYGLQILSSSLLV